MPSMVGGIRFGLVSGWLSLVPRGVSPRRDRPLVWPLVVVFLLLVTGPAGALEFEVQQIRFGLEDISHPALKPQGWLFTGRVGGSLSDVQLDGQISNEAGLEADISVRHVAGEFQSIRLSTTMTGSEAVGIFRNTLTNWPEQLNLLELGSGELSAEVTIHLQPNAPMAVHSRVDFRNLSGLMDRTAITNLSGHLLFSLENNQLTARLRDTTIGQINSGIGIGPISLLADYRAAQAEPFAGELSIQQANAEFLDGRLRTAPRTISLADQPVRIPLDAHEISLTRLLQVYPAEGFEGSGLLSGSIPLEISGTGVEVQQGSITALSPGGMLKLPADQLQAMLGSGGTVETVTRALQNFHYSVLSSAIDYDEKGKLTLGLRLEGNNPDIRNGQPVVLNVNLEEDIPALLTSLQLSGRVNEAVTERVRERLQQSGQEATP